MLMKTIKTLKITVLTFFILLRVIFLITISSLIIYFLHLLIHNFLLNTNVTKMIYKIISSGIIAIIHLPIQFYHDKVVFLIICAIYIWGVWQLFFRQKAYL